MPISKLYLKSTLAGTVLLMAKEKNIYQKGRQGAVRESNPRPLPPEGRIIPLDQRPQRASNEDRTRDLLLTRQMLCQLSYRGETKARAPTKYTIFESERQKGLHRCNCYRFILGASNPSLAMAESFPCSVAGLRRCLSRQCPRHPEPTLKRRWQPQP